MALIRVPGVDTWTVCLIEANGPQVEYIRGASKSKINRMHVQRVQDVYIFNKQSLFRGHERTSNIFDLRPRWRKYAGQIPSKGIQIDVIRDTWSVIANAITWYTWGSHKVHMWQAHGGHENTTPEGLSQSILPYHLSTVQVGYWEQWVSIVWTRTLLMIL
jgi:hypothetical protein